MCVLRFGRYRVALRDSDRPMFPHDGVTKGDLVDYYQNVSTVLLPHLRDRPLMLQRFPGGIGKQGYFQQDCPLYFPGWIDTVTTQRSEKSSGGMLRHVVCNKQAALAYLANQGVITLYGWMSRAAHLGQPDRVVFDLDPCDDDFGAVGRAARWLGEKLRKLGLTPFVMTTGSRGPPCARSAGRQERLRRRARLRPRCGRASRHAAP